MGVFRMSMTQIRIEDGCVYTGIPTSSLLVYIDIYRMHIKIFCILTCIKLYTVRTVYYICIFF